MSESRSRQMTASGNLFADPFRYGLERYGPGRNRSWWGAAYRRWLLDSGRYIRTSKKHSGAKIVGETGPELVGFMTSPEDD